ncbi:MAG: glycosyltransferase family 2 protein [Nitrososphaerota archaeon]|nr:glycosyltransferase family 2 protein [Nitrososphaerota archaeon]
MKEELTFRDKVVLAARDVVSLAPKLGLMKKPNHHKNGVTFIVAVKDGEKWIKSCLLSILSAADEIIVIDSSVEDNTTKIVESLAVGNSKIRHVKLFYDGYDAIALALHIGVALARYRWLFRWDSDCVAKSPEVIQEWVDRLKNLNPCAYYAIDLCRVNLRVDIEHQPCSNSDQFEFNGVRIFTWHPSLRGILKDSIGLEQVVGDSVWGQRLPLFYKLIRWYEPYMFHCDIKSPKNSLLRKYWFDYMLEGSKGARFKSLEEYTAYRVQQDEGLTMEEGIKKHMEFLLKDTMPYDKARFGDLPKLLKDSQDKLN